MERKGSSESDKERLVSRGWEEGVGGAVGGVESESQTRQATKSMEFTEGEEIKAE